MVKDFDRSLDMLERTVNGQTLDQAAAAHSVSTTRALQVTRLAAELLLKPDRLQGDVPPDKTNGPRVWRKHSAFWLRQISKARKSAEQQGVQQ